MYVYGVTIVGDHEQFATRRFYGTALSPLNAVARALASAKDTGWTNTRVTDLTELGRLSFRGPVGACKEGKS